MQEDFRSLSVSTDGPSNFSIQMGVIKSNLQSFLSQTSISWKGESFNHFSSEQRNCINSCKKLETQLQMLCDIIGLINEHIRDLNEKERLEEENRRLYPDLYWYDSDGDEHINRSIQRRIRANESMIDKLINNLNAYVSHIKSITGGIV